MIEKVDMVDFHEQRSPEDHHLLPGLTQTIEKTKNDSFSMSQFHFLLSKQS